jgi:dienelactone hydrolase
MIPTARDVVEAGRGRLAVFRLLNTWRGWDAQRSPVVDTVEALDGLVGESAGEYAGLPVGLVGHSLGGRAALLSGGHPGVRSVVAQNPWLYPNDDVDLSGRRVLFVHGRLDRIAAPDRAEVVARRLARRTEVGFIWIPEGKHAMLARGRDFDRYAAEFTTAVLLGAAAGPVSEPVARVLDGEEWVTV